ncbi:MAG: ORF6N domain-containing protein [bacterium]
MKEHSPQTSIIPAGVEDFILEVRGQRVILDADLARLYGVTTKALNQAVKRNAQRFPHDFILEIRPDEIKELVTNCDRFKNLKYSTR